MRKVLCQDCPKRSEDAIYGTAVRIALSALFGRNRNVLSEDSSARVAHCAVGFSGRIALSALFGRNRNVLLEDSSVRVAHCAVASAGQINFGCASFLWAEPQRPLGGLLRSRCSLRCRFCRTDQLRLRLVSLGRTATSSWRTPPFALLTALSLLPDRSTSAAPRFSGQNRNLIM